MANHSFYLSAKWERARARALRRYHYEDQEAKRYGKTITATMVHHIYPVSDYPELKLIGWNLLPLSQASHNKMHDRYTNQVTDTGKYWQRKFKNDFQKFLSEKNIPPTSKNNF